MTHLGSRIVLVAAAIVTVALWQGSVFGQQKFPCIGVFDGGWTEVFHTPGKPLPPKDRCDAYQQKVDVGSGGHNPQAWLSREAPFIVVPAQIPHKNNPNPAPWITKTFGSKYDPGNPKQWWDWVFLVLGSKRCELKGILPHYPLMVGGGETALFGTGVSTLDGKLIFVFYADSTLVYDARNLDKGAILTIPYPVPGATGHGTYGECMDSWLQNCPANFPVTLGSGYYLLDVQMIPGIESDTWLVIRLRDGKAQVVGSLRENEAQLGYLASMTAATGVFVDDRAFALLVEPPTGCDELERYAVYRVTAAYVVAAEYTPTHQASGRVLLPDGASDVKVSRNGKGALVCHFRLGNVVKEQAIVLKALGTKERCRFSETQVRWHFWVDGSGEIFQLPGKRRVDYTRKADGSHYTFFPYRRYSYLQGSPQGRYLAVEGALPPEENPNGPGSACERPGFFHKGYDSVVLVYDVRRRQVVRIFNVPPHMEDTEDRMEGMRSVFSDDGKLFFIDSLGGTDVYDTSRWDGPRLGAVQLLELDTPIRFVGAGPTPGSARYLAPVGRYGLRLALLEKTKSAVKELMEIPFNKLTSELGAGVPRPLPAAGALGLVGCPYAGGGPNSPWAVVQVINLKSHTVSKPLALPEGAQDVKLVRRKDGSLVCRFQTAKGAKEMAIVPLKKQAVTGGSSPGSRP